MPAVNPQYYTVFRQHTQYDTKYPRGSPWVSDVANLQTILLMYPILKKTIPILSLQHEWKHCLAGIFKMDFQFLLQKVKGGYLADLRNQLHSSGLQGM